MNQAAIRILFPIAIIAVLAVAIFGFAIMSEPGHMMVGCLGSTSGGNCAVLSPAEHFEAHLRGFQNISTAMAQGYSFFVTLFLILLASIPLKASLKNDPHEEFASGSRKNFISPQRIRFAHWLALREKRDPSLAGAVNR